MLNRREMVILAAAAATPALTVRSAAAQTPVVPAGAEAAFDREASAEELVRAMFTLQSSTGSAIGTVGTTAEQDAESLRTLSPFLDPAYQMQRASGERYVVDTYVPADVDLFEITDVRETRPTDTLVVARYAARTPGSSTSDTNMVMSDSLAPRLTVFHWDAEAGHWNLLSHANFNTPVAAICDTEPLTPPDNPEVPTSAEDVAKGIALAEEFARLVVEGDPLPILDPQIQGQSGSGKGYTTVSELTPTNLQSLELSDFLVTRNDDVIVVSSRGVQTGSVLGVATAPTPEPRLMTFRLDDSGEWKVVAVATFATASSVPEGAECAQAGS